MKRTAILVNANSASAGAKQDLDYWHSYLVSPIGGAWVNNEEVHVVSNPSKEDILNLVRPATSDDYVIVVYIGHGELRKDRLGFPETFLSLGGSDTISERELNPRSDRCSIFIDTARRSYSDILVATKPIPTSEIGSPRARDLFNSEFEKAEKGCVKIYAAKFSSDFPNDHSFSVKLISHSVEWATRNHGVLDLHQAISLTSTVSERSHSSEAPRYQGGRRLHHFPFAVNPIN